ncbi:MAG: hydantoinase/oxoprolinase family protein, partial [Rhodospirillaceae bacterium]|nr:hydantoinase/oxoprolinase family protein [Rhodospirillaceae bacterium]
AHYVARQIGDPDIVTVDMGGTSVDVSILQNEIRYATENTVGDFPVIMPAVDVSAVGAGGGSIAWTDAEGVLKVGPESAGAVPGPACYGRGGTRPTVTDAYLTAGIVAPDSFLGGEMKLDREAAHAAIDSVASVLGFSRAETADAILQVTTANIYAELLPQMARRGVDTSGFSMVAYGAAGPTQVFMLARELNMRRVFVPPSPGILCALGCLVADFRADFVQSIWREARDFPDDELQTIYRRLEEQARSWLADQDVELDQVYILRSADLCYVGQSYEVNVPFPDVASGELATSKVVDWFNARYGQVYGYTDTDAPARMLEARLQIVGVTPKPAVHLVTGAEDAPSGPKGTRMIHERGEALEATVWQRGSLRSREFYEGPMVVEQYDTTVYVPAGFRVTVDDHANLIGERI